MRFIAAVALFTASAKARAFFPGDWPLDKAPDNLPKGQCLVWPANQDGCNSQWAQFDDYCNQFWDKACEKVDEAWYSQDSDWKVPDSPADECFDLNMSTDCKEDWELLLNQCNNKGASGNMDGPYDWNSDCDVAVSLLGGIKLWNGDERRDWKPVATSNFPNSAVPEDMCLVWATAYDGTCSYQWELIGQECSYERYWTPFCTNNGAMWYSQDLDWVDPTRPEQKCFSFDFGEDCTAQWDTFWAQCMNMADSEKYYMWTNACEAYGMLQGAQEMWNDDSEMTREEQCDSQDWEDCDEALVMRKTNFKEMVSQQRPLGMRSPTTSSQALWRKQSAVKATSAATALLDKPAKKTQKADYSGCVYGAAAAIFGICATVALAKRDQNKKLTVDYARA